MDDFVVSPDVTGIAFEGLLLLLDARNGQLRAYEVAAAELWQAYGGPIASAPAPARPRRPAARDRAWTEDWLAAGLIRPADADPQPALAPPPPPGWAELPEPDWSAQWHCRIDGIRAAFAVEHPRGAAMIRRLLGHFECEPGPADIRLEIRDTGPEEAALLRDGAELLRTGDAGLLVGAIYQALLECVHGIDRWHALMHAGAVACDGRAIAFPAPSGSGKTTLVAGLIARGFTYVSDDLVAVAAADGRVAPWPMPLSIKAGSWPLLEPLHPQLAEAPAILAGGRKARLLAPPAAPWREYPELRALVFPVWRAGGGASLSRLGSGEALLRLLTDRVWLGHPLTLASVARFLDWFGTIPCYALDHASLGDAEPAVRRILAK